MLPQNQNVLSMIERCPYWRTYSDPLKPKSPVHGVSILEVAFCSLQRELETELSADKTLMQGQRYCLFYSFQITYNKLNMPQNKFAFQQADQGFYKAEGVSQLKC